MFLYIFFEKFLYIPTLLFLLFVLPFIILFFFYLLTTIIILLFVNLISIIDFIKSHENKILILCKKICLYLISFVWIIQGKIFHGHEIKGLENIPKDKNVLLIFYHGALPIDLYYILAKLYIDRGILIHIVGDNFLFKIPGWKSILKFLNIIPGTVDSCSKILKTENNILAIAPGGLFESQFGDENYKLLWGDRKGFTKIAINSKVDIIPIFTENIRDAYRTLHIFKSLSLKLYYKTRLPTVPIYGGFPVKLTTHIGKPISFKGEDPEELKRITMESLENLIIKNQKQPNILKSIFERFYKIN